MSVSLATRVLELIKERRDRILRGLVNCIPLPFQRFRVWFPGIERARYYLVTANQKVGKSKFTDKMFVYDPFFYFRKYPEKGSVKVLYFTREMSKEDKMIEFYSHLLYRISNKRVHIAPADLKSTREDKPVPEEVLELLESEGCQAIIRDFEETVTYIDDIGNPTGVNKYCRAWAEEHGHFTYTDRVVRDEMTGKPKTVQVIDRYVPDDPEQIVIIVFDNAATVVPESGMDLRDSISKLSKYFMTLRNQLGFSPVLIQHQAQAQEGVDNVKIGMTKPSSNGLADCKSTSRDINVAIGLYSPMKFGIHNYEGYDIDRFRDNIRFMEIIEDRDYGANGLICPLYFDGAISVFEELPKADDRAGIQAVYDFIDKTRRVALIAYKKKRSFKSLNFMRKHG